MKPLTILISLKRAAVLLLLVIGTEPVPAPDAIFCWFLGGSRDVSVEKLASSESCESSFQLVIQTNRKQ
jgi:hypothetical protein